MPQAVEAKWLALGEAYASSAHLCAGHREMYVIIFKTIDMYGLKNYLRR